MRNQIVSEIRKLRTTLSAYQPYLSKRLSKRSRKRLKRIVRATDEARDLQVELGWLVAYSPYHRVRNGVDYPAVLFTTFDSDTRVDPLHARKMCAALQHGTAGTRPVLLRREKDVGHGARSVSRTVALSVD